MLRVQNDTGTLAPVPETGKVPAERGQDLEIRLVLCLLNDDASRYSPKLIGYRGHSGRRLPRSLIEAHVHLMNSVAHRQYEAPPSGGSVLQRHRLPVGKITHQLDQVCSTARETEFNRVRIDSLDAEAC